MSPFVSEYTKEISVNNDKFTIYSLKKLESRTGKTLNQYPYSIKVLLEQVLRHQDNKIITEKDIDHLLAWTHQENSKVDIPFKPSRVVLQDFTGVPALVDLASLRNAMDVAGKDATLINPQIPVDLIIDHSVQVDQFGHSLALLQNMDVEFDRNRERYEFLKWGQNAFQNLRVFPPGIGIIHQVNLEYLASVIQSKEGVLFPDTLVGTDSHTTMINGLGVLGWGVGGIEAEAALLGQPLYLRIPDVVGFKLTGELPIGTTATDLVLRIVEILRQKGVVEKFVEFFGPGLSKLPLADRATIANMAPEYGATMGFFPVDEQTLDYLRLTGRSETLITQVKSYCQEQGLFRTENAPEPLFNDQVTLDLSTVVPALAGPKRPQDRIELNHMSTEWESNLTRQVQSGGFGIDPKELPRFGKVESNPAYEITDGSVVIAAITSCTNTSNPSVMLAAGLLAQKAVEKGLVVKPWVKTSLAPGSRVVTEYLKASNLEKPLESLGFHTVGYGCTTCIGNSGPLSVEIQNAIEQNRLVVASVLSGNRNFEGRINPNVKANFLASPPLVVAFAIAGNVNIDFQSEPVGTDPKGQPVMLSQIWPSNEEIKALVNQLQPEMFNRQYQKISESSPIWNKIETVHSPIYNWKDNSTYIRNPPFFKGLSQDLEPLKDITNAYPLAILGDSVTTDHISPAGNIAVDSPAADYLKGHGISSVDFNSYGSRRGNDEVMLRGTFANIRLRNLMNPGKEGGFTNFIPENRVMNIYDAAQAYQKAGTNLIIIAGSEYGTGSSRDWAAKGTYLLGVKAVVAKSFERIHRSNLVGMGVLPLQFAEDIDPSRFLIDISIPFSITGIVNDIKPGSKMQLRQGQKTWDLICRIDTPIEIEYYKNGGILHTFLRQLMNQN